jgi:hypothetical protein
MIFKKRETQMRGIPLTSLSTLGTLESGQYCSDRALTRATGLEPSRRLKIIELLDLGDAVPSIEPVVARYEVAELQADTRAQETVEQYREHEQGESHVQAITFDGESCDGEGDASDGGGNEK